MYIFYKKSRSDSCIKFRCSRYTYFLITYPWKRRLCSELIVQLRVWFHGLYSGIKDRLFISIVMFVEHLLQETLKNMPRSKYAMQLDIFTRGILCDPSCTRSPSIKKFHLLLDWSANKTICYATVEWRSTTKCSRTLEISMVYICFGHCWASQLLEEGVVVPNKAPLPDTWSSERSRSKSVYDNEGQLSRSRLLVYVLQTLFLYGIREQTA